MTVLPVMLLVGSIAGVVSFGIVQSLVRLFPRGREPVPVRHIEARRPSARIRAATLQ